MNENRSKHLLAAGVGEVVYMEPYPKSRAKELHEHEIQLEKKTSDNSVAFLPFMGISPLRYRDVFQKGKRKRDGIALDWMDGSPKPLIDISATTHTDLESYEVLKLFGSFKKA